MPQILPSLATRCAGVLSFCAIPWLVSWSSLPAQAPINTVVASPVVQNVPRGSFESVSGPAGQTPTAPFHTNLSNTTLLGWSFGPDAGIAHRHSAFFLAPQPLLLGDRAAYLSGTLSTLSTTATGLTPGSWRLRYKIARGAPAAGGVSEPFLEVRFRGVRVALEGPRNDAVAEVDTRVEIVPNGVTTALLEFRRVADPNTGAVAPGTVLIDDVRLEKVPEWASTSTWSLNAVPTGSDPVIVPAGKVVAVSGSRVCDSMDIHGEVLALPTNGGLTASWIAVTGPGSRMEVGREHVPFLQNFVVEMKGPGAAHPYGAGDNFLMAMDSGVVDLHGEPRTSWTRLVEGTAVGATQFRVADATGWRIGDELVVTGSTLDRNPNAPVNAWIDYAEKVQIGSIVPVTGPGGVVQYDIGILGSPLQHAHLGGPAAVTTLAVAGAPAGVPATLDQSAEVANLTRNVRVQGDPAASPPLSSGARRAGHVMIMHCPMCSTGGGKGRFSHAEFVRLGREAEMGRYPIHFHMLTEGGKDSFVRGCSVHETFNRAITVHGTDGVVLDRNVGYRVNGHAVFLEDGSEMFNRITGNLMVSVLRPRRADEGPPGISLHTIPSDNSLIDFRDRSPSAYWITNPYNIIRDNVAAGTVGCGFWMIPVRRVLGASAADDKLLARTAAIDLPFLADSDGKTGFRDNRAHGCGLGFDFNDSVSDAAPPFYDPADMVTTGVKKNQSWTPSVPVNPAEPIEAGIGARTTVRQTASGCVAYGCKSGVYSSTGGDQVVFEGLVVADCEIATDFAAYHEVRLSALVEQAAYGYANIQGTGINGAKVCVMLYDGATRVVDSVVHGYPVVGASTAIGARGGAVNHPNHVFDGVLFTASPNVGVKWFPAVPQPLGSVGTLGPTAGLAVAYPNVQFRSGSLTDPQNPLDPSKTGAVVFDEDGKIADPTALNPVPWSLVWDRHFHETSHPAEAPFGTNVRKSLHRFAHLRLLYQAQPKVLTAAHDVLYHRTRQTYGMPPSWPAGDRGFEDAHRTRQHKQVPIIVGMAGASTTPSVPPGGGPAVLLTDHFVYTIDHLDAAFLTGPHQPLELTIDDALAGDVAYLRLADLDGKQANQIAAVHLDGAAVPEFTDFHQFMATTQPALWIETVGATTRIHLRMFVRGVGQGSQPAGSRSYVNPPLYPTAHSTNLPDSRWRNETVRITWQ